MSTGWVYVMSNPSMPSLVKVGWTSKLPEERAIELSGVTGVPTPFKVETAFLFSNRAVEVERKAHELLSENRCNKEFFACTPHFAAEKILDAREAIGEEVKDIDPVLLTEEELRERTEAEKRKAEEAARQREIEEWRNAERQRPCKRFYWVQAYSPYKGHYGREYSRGPTGFFPENYSHLIWCFTECDCLSCKEDRFNKRENPLDYYTYQGTDKIYERVVPHLRRKIDSLAPNDSVGFEEIRDVCLSSGSSQLESLNDAAVMREFFRFETLNEHEKILYMQRFRVFANDVEHLSQEEIDLVECDKHDGIFIIGVDWETNGGGWKCTWMQKGFLRKLVDGFPIEEEVFPCKREAVRHFRSQHNNDPEMPIRISQMPCPCDACRKVEHQMQAERNKYKNLNR